MVTIDCPLCAGEAATDEGLTLLVCDGCGFVAEVASETIAALDAAA